MIYFFFNGGFMEFIRIEQKNKDLKKIERLYITAFPEDERIPFVYLQKKLKKKTTYLYALYDPSFKGFVYCTLNKDILYIFYLAIQDEDRGQGYGSSFLKFLKETFSHCRLV